MRDLIGIVAVCYGLQAIVSAQAAVLRSSWRTMRLVVHSGASRSLRIGGLGSNPSTSFDCGSG